MDIRRATKIFVNFFYVVEFQYEDALTIKTQLEKCLRAWRGRWLYNIYVYIWSARAASGTRWRAASEKQSDDTCRIGWKASWSGVDVGVLTKKRLVKSAWCQVRQVSLCDLTSLQNSSDESIRVTKDETNKAYRHTRKETTWTVLQRVYWIRSRR